MRTNLRPSAAVVSVVVFALAIFGWSAAALAQTHTVHLVADEFSKSVTLPNDTVVSVPMWGYALSDEFGAALPGEAVSSPGPRLVVPDTASTLTIVLHNRLAENTSLVIPGQAYAATPAATTGGRLRAMTVEVAPGGTGTYTFTNYRPGTFLYQSGSNPVKQIQMGLYGAATKDAAPGTAYAGVAFSHEVVLLYSEIDRAMHQSVFDGTYGTPDGPASTIDYYPTLFLINGAPYANDVATPPIGAGAVGQSTLIRFLNAGLRTHAPVLDNGSLSLVAEDGNKLPFARPQAAVLLAAGKTHDALWTPMSGGVYSVYDRSLSLTAGGQGASGMLAKLAITGPAGPADAPVAVNDLFTVAEDANTSGNVLANDLGTAATSDDPTGAELVSSTGSGTLTFPGDGTFTYTPAPNFFGVDSFTYRAVNAAGSTLATATITVAAVPDMPAALAQAFGVPAGETLPLSIGGADPDGEVLSFYLTTLPASGTLSRVSPVDSTLVALTAADLRTGPGTGTPIAGGSLIYTAAAASSSFEFVASDTAGATVSAPAAVTITVHTTAAAPEETIPLSLNVVGPNGETIGAYRWTLEEDRTYDVQPGILDPDTLSVTFHRSYMPVIQAGDETTAGDDLKIDPAKRYFVSVLPTFGPYTNGGAPVAAGQTSVTVRVNKGPMPTAQIRVRVFHDNAGLNGQWDTSEIGLPGFAVTIEDAGGRYGMSAAQQLMDAFGNPIGTIYGPCPTQECDSYSVVAYGNGYVLSDNDGWALIENLAPGKYGVKVVAPGGTAWQQTATIEGTRVIDAWVKANEPSFFAEFGPPGPHAEIGFTLPTNTLGSGPNTISGQVTNLHHSRPPAFQSFSGATFNFTQPWVALNEGVAGGSVLYAQPTDADGNFSIAGLPNGTYELVVFDSALNIIIASKVINVTASVNLGPVPVQQWFTRLYNYVFDDPNENGFRDAGEAGVPEQAINLRWRDGSMYQSMPTDTSGFVPFEQVFPFFSWLVAEVDFTRFKATGATVLVDDGGNLTDSAWPDEVGAEGLDPKHLQPQIQTGDGGGKYRTETGPVLLEAFQGFIGQSSVILWGKTPYAPAGSILTDVNVAPLDDFPGPACSSGGVAGVDCDVDANGNGVFDGDLFHGGVSGIVHYSTTRAENDPRWGGAEVWEPGIAGVTVQLWSADRMRLLNEVTTDAWDENLPAGCKGEPFIYLGATRDCFDGLRNFNQVRPGVFDGGYAFLSQIEPIVVGPETNWLTPVADRAAGFREVPLTAGQYIVRIVPPRGYKVVKEEDKNVDFGDEYIPQQFYLSGYPLADGGAAEAPPPAGAAYEPLAVPFCVGSLHEVPAELALFPGVPTAYGGDRRPLCDQKLVTLRNGQNPGANFFLFTEAPIAGHIVGFVLDDTTNEFDPNSPQFGEKYAPPFMPVSIRDWTGREITSTLTDAYGRYNVLVPSTYTANQPIPSGMSPNMLTACINSPTMVNAAGITMSNPHHYKQYSHFCYTLQYMPGTTTYLDTPVVPTGAFTGNGQFPVDAELPSGTPVVAKVTNIANLTTGAEDVSAQIGPYIVDRTTTVSPNALPGTRTIDITAAGMSEVPNPAYDGVGSLAPKTILRDYTFGADVARVRVSIGGVLVPAANVSIAPGGMSSGAIQVLRVVVPRGTTTGALSVERCFGPAAAPCTVDLRKSVLGITLTVATPGMHAARPPIVKAANQTIQAAIDAAPTGALVLVPPGIYEEAIVMKKPVRLQGWGAPSTVVNTVAAPAERLQAWRTNVAALLNDQTYLLPEQIDILGPPPLTTEGLSAALGGEAAGVLVFGKPLPIASTLSGACLQNASAPYALINEAYCLQNEAAGGAVVRRANARIDGFSLIGSSDAAGIMVNANARSLDIGNNRISNNTGNFAGGIRVGHPGAVQALADADAHNPEVTIHHNLVAQNAGIDAAGGGGIVIGTGANGYRIAHNFIAGNFTGGQGGGIAHIGRSPGGVIDRNAIVFNEGFNELTRSGGGVFIGGTPPAAGALTAGSGNVTLSNNLIQGNQAASGDGGGVALDGVNGGGPDATTGPAGVARSRIGLYNNIIVNNVAGLAGGGVSLHDAAFVDIVHNTISRNDSLATAGGAFTIGGGDTSMPQPAGIVSRGHTAALDAALDGPAFSQPTILNSIVWQNRSFFFGQVSGGVQIPGDPNPAPITFGLVNAGAGSGRATCSVGTATYTCWDFGVLGETGTIVSANTVVTSTTASPGTANTQAQPAYVASYVNASRNPTIVMPELTVGIATPIAFDEGGTFIRPIFGPLTLQDPGSLALIGNYHVTAGVNVGANGGAPVPLIGPGGISRAALRFDFDGQARPSSAINVNTGADRGADQKLATVAAQTNPLPVEDGASPISTPSTGLVAAWEFEEGAGLTALDSAGTNHGALSGGIVRVPGRTGSGQALLFNGVNGLVTVPDAAALDLTNAMTLEAWVNPTTTNALWQSVLLKERGTAASPVGLVYSLYGNSGPDGGAATYVRPTSVASDQGLASPDRLTAGAWHHIAATFGDGSLRLYVDGVEIATQALTGSLPNSGRPLFIGGNVMWGEFFGGIIDDVKIYNRVLSPLEIATAAAMP